MRWLNYVLFALIGLVLAANNLTYLTWGFWVMIILISGVYVNARLEEDC